MSQTKAQLIDNLVQPITGALGSASAPTFSFTSDPNTGIYSPGADQLAISTNGTGRLEINNAGVISHKVYDRWEQNDGTSVAGYIGNANLVLSSGNQADFALRSQANIAFATGGGTERMRLDSSGRLGIGTSSPSAALHVVTSGAGQIRYFDGAVTGAFGSFGSGNEVFLGSGKALAFTTNGITSSETRMTIDTSGRVGIGTTNPNSSLNVVADSGAVGLTIQNRTANDYGYLRFQNNAGTETQAYIGCERSGTSAGRLLFETAGSERMRLDTSGRLLVGTSTATANGGVLQVSNGITFPATQSACSDANTLDDYEEGDWTPRIRDSSNNAATAGGANSGSYTKIGNRVFLTGRVQTSSVVGLTGTSTAFITGLPFTIESGNKGRSALTAGYANGLATGGAYAVTGYGENGDLRISLTKFDSTNGISALTINQWSDDGDMLFSFYYLIN